MKAAGYFFIFFSLLFSLVSTAADTGSSGTEVIRIVKSSPNDHQSHNYYSKLLELALTKTAISSHPAKLEPINEYVLQERAMRELDGSGSIDIFWTVTSKEREEQALTVRVPLLEGMMGYRVALILDKELNRFLGIDNDDELKGLVAGQGHDWPDFRVLASNGFKVVGTSAYDSLVELLRRGRVDYFPRAINEAVVELEALDDDAIVIEPNYLIHYPSYIFFFVSKSKPELAKRIEKGLLMAQQDGSFRALFEDYVDISLIKSKLNISNRKLIRLSNPLLSDKTKAFAKEAPLTLLSELSELNKIQKNNHFIQSSSDHLLL